MKSALAIQRNGTNSVEAVRVLVLHNATRLEGGGEIVVRQEMRMLQNAGVEVHLLLKENSKLNFHEKQKLFLSPAFSKVSYEIVSDAISSYRPTLIHIHNFTPQWTWAAFSASIERSIPVIHTMHSYGLICPANLMLLTSGEACDRCVGSSKYNSLLNKCQTSSLAMKIINARSLSSEMARSIIRHELFTVIVLSPFGRQLLLNDGFREENIVVKPHFAQSNNFPSAPHQSKSVLFVGRLSYEKGVDHIIHEFSKIKDFGLQLRIIGDGPLKQELQELAEDLGLANRVLFLGAQPREVCAKEYATSMCLVMNSKTFEGFGLVVIEAFAAGIPVIAPDFGAMRFLIKDGYNGLLVDPNIRDLSRKIETLYRRPDLCRRLGKNALESYYSQFTPEKNIDRLLGCYKYAIQKSGNSLPARLVGLQDVSLNDFDDRN